MSALIPRRCAGTPGRQAVHIGDVHFRYDPAKAGCGRSVRTVQVAATAPDRPGARPLFARTAPAVICPHCDGPSPLPDHVVDVDELEDPTS